MRKMWRNRFIISKYRLIVASIYSSGEIWCIIKWVSTTMNIENRNAPPIASINSNPLDWRNICKIPPMNRTHSAAKSLKHNRITKVSHFHFSYLTQNKHWNNLFLFENWIMLDLQQQPVLKIELELQPLCHKKKQPFQLCKLRQ